MTAGIKDVGPAGADIVGSALSDGHHRGRPVRKQGTADQAGHRRLVARVGE